MESFLSGAVLIFDHESEGNLAKLQPVTAGQYDRLDNALLVQESAVG
jgi:hypothetical protein